MPPRLTLVFVLAVVALGAFFTALVLWRRHRLAQLREVDWLKHRDSGAYAIPRKRELREVTPGSGIMTDGDELVFVPPSMQPRDPDEKDPVE